MSEGRKELKEKEELWAKLPQNACELTYTTNGFDPRISSQAKRIKGDIDLSELLKNRSSVKICIRAVDGEGNFSDAAELELVSKERKYEIQVESDIFGEKEATFKCPDDTEGLVAVLKSVISYGVKRKLLSKDKAQKLETLLRDLTMEK
jgi:hypothetical protein